MSTASRVGSASVQLKMAEYSNAYGKINLRFKVTDEEEEDIDADDADSILQLLMRADEDPEEDEEDEEDAAAAAELWRPPRRSRARAGVRVGDERGVGRRRRGS